MSVVRGIVATHILPVGCRCCSKAGVISVGEAASSLVSSTLPSSSMHASCMFLPNNVMWLTERGEEQLCSSEKTLGQISTNIDRALLIEDVVKEVNEDLA